MTRHMPVRLLAIFAGETNQPDKQTILFVYADVQRSEVNLAYEIIRDCARYDVIFSVFLVLQDPKRLPIFGVRVSSKEGLTARFPDGDSKLRLGSAALDKVLINDRFGKVEWIRCCGGVAPQRIRRQ